MKSFREVCAIVAICYVIFMVIFTIGGLTHEADIRRQCLKNGYAGYAGWLGNFECHINSDHK